MLAALGGGALAVVLALFGYAGLSHFGADPSWDQLGGESVSGALGSALTIGVIEETAKLLPVLLIGAFSRHFDEALDGLVYAGCAGIGFSLAETLVLTASGEAVGFSLAARLLAAPMSHALLALPAGYGVGRLVMGRLGVKFSAGFAISITAHALYDLLLARPQLGSAWGAGLMLLLWGWFLWLTPRLRRAATAPPR